MNQTTIEEYFDIQQMVERFGLLFYLVNPLKSSFEKVEDCPDYVNQVSDNPATAFISPDQGNPLHRPNGWTGSCYQSFCQGQASEHCRQVKDK